MERISCCVARRRRSIDKMTTAQACTNTHRRVECKPAFLTLALDLFVIAGLHKTPRNLLGCTLLGSPLSEPLSSSSLQFQLRELPAGSSRAVHELCERPPPPPIGLLDLTKKNKKSLPGTNSISICAGSPADYTLTRRTSARSWLPRGNGCCASFRVACAAPFP
jgi:hypothetical protein